jgi:hypothetical protein
VCVQPSRCVPLSHLSPYSSLSSPTSPTYSSYFSTFSSPPSTTQSLHPHSCPYLLSLIPSLLCSILCPPIPSHVHCRKKTAFFCLLPLS